MKDICIQTYIYKKIRIPCYNCSVINVSGLVALEIASINRELRKIEIVFRQIRILVWKEITA